MATYQTKDRRHDDGTSSFHNRRRPAFPVVRWGALATGSLLGIGAWALAYILGATLLVVCGVDAGAPTLWSRIFIGIYGALSASLALALAAYTAARTGGAHTVESALFYGLGLWSMSTITLVLTTSLAGFGYFTAEMLRTTPLFTVGLAAVGSLPGQMQMGSASTLGAILATLLVSLWAGLWGACRAQRRMVLRQ
jgi:hypothetical protein